MDCPRKLHNFEFSAENYNKEHKHILGSLQVFVSANTDFITYNITFDGPKKLESYLHKNLEQACFLHFLVNMQWKHDVIRGYYFLQFPHKDPAAAASS